MANTAVSQIITDIESTPIVKANTLEKGGRIHTDYATIPSTSFIVTTAAQTYAFCRVPVRARLLSIKLTHAAMGNGAVSMGLARPNSAGSATVVDSTCLSAGLAMANARAGAEAMDAVSAANRALSIASAFSTAIGTAGATADTDLDIILAVTTVSTGAAVAMGMAVEYVLPE